MVDIFNLNKQGIIGLQPEAVTEPFSWEELEHILRQLDCIWKYDYSAYDQGRAGLHALLKSGRHSEAFVLLKNVLLEYPNMRQIFAAQMVAKFRECTTYPDPIWIAGVPAAASKLAESVAEILGAKCAEMHKDESGVIVLDSDIPEGESIWPIEDVCTKGTGISEAIRAIRAKCSKANILPVVSVVLNRGGLSEVDVPEIGAFDVVYLTNRLIRDYPADNCPLCGGGSKPIKPKADPENWQLIKESQL